MNIMDWIVKGKKITGKCECCGTYKMNFQTYKWYSLFDSRLLLEHICLKCAKRELGSKNKKAHKEILLCLMS